MESSDSGRDPNSSALGPPSFSLRLRAKKVVKWGEDVVDNEDMGKRKSKRCCIFHKRKKFGESSSESEYSSGAESGPESPGRQRRALCTCEARENADGGEGSASVVAGAKRGPFTQRRQEQERAASQDNSWSLDGPCSPSSASAGGVRDENAPTEAAVLPVNIRDLLTDAAAVDQLQVEYRPPHQHADAGRDT
jgi:hypothetical protein